MVLFLDARYPEHPAAKLGDMSEASLHALLGIWLRPLWVPRDPLNPCDLKAVELYAIDQRVTRQPDRLHRS